MDYRAPTTSWTNQGVGSRNSEVFDSLFPTTDIIYDGLNFEAPFISDISQAKQSVVISCPRVKIGRHSQIAERLIDWAASGKEVVLHTKDSNDDTLRLQHQGISVIGCSASATACRAVGRQEANARAAIRRKRSFACFISLLWTQVKGILQEYNAQ